MRLDGTVLPAGAELAADVAIVGAGPAGIVLARTLSDRGLHVCLLESGDATHTPTSQRLTRGTSVGREYPPLERARIRAIGGSSNHWYPPGKTGWSPDGGMRSRPLGDIDFAERSWVPFSGWPLGAEELGPFYERAKGLCGIAGSLDYAGAPPLQLSPDTFVSTRHRFANVDTFRTLAEALSSGPLVSLVTNVTATEIARDVSEPSRIDHVVALTALRRRITVRASVFVLAAGGLENARLLLLSRDASGRALGNSNDLVGRYFMEHLHVDAGMVEPAGLDLIGASDFYVRSGGNVESVGVISLTEAAQQREGLLNVDLAPVVTYAPFYNREFLTALRARERFGFGRLPVELKTLAPAAQAYLRAGWRSKFGSFPSRRDVFGVVALAEQAPSPASRVFLGEQRDELGQQRLVLDWRLGDQEMRSVRRALALFDEALQAGGYGQLRLFDDTPELKWSWHHMGTTRMHVDSAKGVVDPNSRLHEVANLFVAGSSVFPTGGAATVTLTIAALALRLADHIAALTVPSSV